MAVRPVNHERFYSERAKKMDFPAVRKAASAWRQDKQHIINFASGIPNPATFPVQSLDVTLRDGTKFSIKDGAINEASQYGANHGLPETVEVLRDLVVKLHHPPTASTPVNQGGLDITVTSGNTESMSKMIEEFLNPGDFVMVEDPCWPTVMEMTYSRGIKVLGVQADSQGMIPSSLRQVLSQWSPEDALNPESDIPKLVITFPHGSNPTGSTIPLERKREIYQICREYDILILEDDPYCYLLYDQDPVPSYLSMDEDGRVIRLDSFSKILAPGFRCSFVSASAPFIQKLVINIASSVSHVNGLGQVIYTQTLKLWGLEGFLDHAKKYSSFYKEKRDFLARSIEKHLKGLVEYETPSGGMFFWIKVKGVRDTRKMMGKRAVDAGVVVVPGSYFFVDAPDSPYIRITFAYPNEQQMEEGISRLAKMIRQLQEEEDVDKSDG